MTSDELQKATSATGVVAGAQHRPKSVPGISRTEEIRQLALGRGEDGRVVLVDGGLLLLPPGVGCVPEDLPGLGVDPPCWGLGQAGGAGEEFHHAGEADGAVETLRGGVEADLLEGAV